MTSTKLDHQLGKYCELSFKNEKQQLLLTLSFLTTFLRVINFSLCSIVFFNVSYIISVLSKISDRFAFSFCFKKSLFENFVLSAKK